MKNRMFLRDERVAMTHVYMCVCVFYFMVPTKKYWHFQGITIFPMWNNLFFLHKHSLQLEYTVYTIEFVLKD